MKPYCILFPLTLAVSSITPAFAAISDDEFFEKNIRPVLIEHCMECHGEKKQKGGLRLDSRAAAIAGGDLGAALLPGHPDRSPLIEAVRYEKDDMQMPPKKKLPDAVIADLMEWVKRGAPWPGGSEEVAISKADGPMNFTPEHLAHWAFQPVRKPAVPRPENDKWCRTDIDRFILSKLEAQNRQPTPPVDDTTLLRRLSFDLTGLPPTQEEIAAYQPETHAAQVDAYLGSIHHAERYARHWLDVARYADSNGSEVDHAMANAWRYRDYVVRSLHADVPFDRFVREQVAGDLLPDMDEDSLTATGFLMLGPKALADLDKPKLAMDIVDEQVDTLGRAFMGLTLGCARCHDHKFDPVGDEDYYALAGIFKSTRTMVDMTKRVVTWHERPPGGAEDAARIEALTRRIATLQKERNASVPAKSKATPKLAAEATYLVIEAEDFTRANVRVDTDSVGRGIGVVRTRMEYPDRIEYEFELPSAGEYQLELRYAAKESRPTEITLNGNLEEMAGAAEVTGDWTPQAQRWFVQGRYLFLKGRNTLVFGRDGPVPLFDKFLIGRVSAEPHSKKVAHTPSAKSPVDTGVDLERKRKIDAEIAATQGELESIPTVMAPVDGPVADTTILVRGNPGMPGEVVTRGFLRIVPELQGVTKPDAAQSGRLELARWLTHPAHPLTARVIVNRVWLWHFGEGLTPSPDNFGLRGEAPTHPELMDWLAAWFMENGWSLKKLHRLICESAVYRCQTGNGEPSPFRRLSAEELRDAMLAVSGRLDRTVSGSLMTVMNRTYANGGNAPPDIVSQMHYDTPRRSLYLPVVRGALHDFFSVFDYPDPGMLTGKRSQTTVAPQALFLMNSPFVKEQASAFAQRVLKMGPDDTARVRAAHLLAFSRPAREAEVAMTLAFLERDETALREAGETSPRNMAWSRLCHALLISNDFLYLR